MLTKRLDKKEKKTKCSKQQKIHQLLLMNTLVENAQMILEKDVNLLSKLWLRKPDQLNELSN